MIQTDAMIDFKYITLEDKPLYEEYLASEGERGCEYSFANLYLWGRQNFAKAFGHIVMFSQFNRRSVYPYPIGSGDKKAVIDAIIADAEARGIPCRITGLSASDREVLESLYPSRFRFHCDEAAFDYVYSIDDLAELSGKKYHAKRNHLNRFYESCPNYSDEPLSEANIDSAQAMVEEWFEQRLAENPNGDYHMEHTAISRAFKCREALGLEGFVLLDGDGRTIAVTFGSRIFRDTFDVHFEKARTDINGVYAAVNNEFAKYIRSKYPEIRYLNREEDMGIEGLRKAKKSYYPHHMIEKYWACLLEDGYEY